jgi:hypothetical protein
MEETSLEVKKVSKPSQGNLRKEQFKDKTELIVFSR